MKNWCLFAHNKRPSFTIGQLWELFDYLFRRNWFLFLLTLPLLIGARLKQALEREKINISSQSGQEKLSVKQDFHCFLFRFFPETDIAELS